MKKVLKSKVLPLVFLFVIAVSAFSFLAHAKKRVSVPVKECCVKTEPDGSEMLWDILSRQFVSSIHIR